MTGRVEAYGSAYRTRIYSDSAKPIGLYEGYKKDDFRGSQNLTDMLFPGSRDWSRGVMLCQQKALKAIRDRIGQFLFSCLAYVTSLVEPRRASCSLVTPIRSYARFRSFI